MNCDFESLYNALGGTDIVFDEPMSKHTTFRIGGNAKLFALPETSERLMEILNTADAYNVPHFVFGNGSNLLVSDSGADMLVVSLRKLNHSVSVDRDSKSMICGAGVMFATAVTHMADAGLMGLEWGFGIPGTIGGAIAMNAGAYGGEISERLTKVRVLRDGKMLWEDVDKSQMGYRKSPYSYPDCIVTEAEFALEETDGKVHERIHDFTERRKAKQPLNHPSAGSTFLRPEGYFVGPLIEKAGLKGFSVGGAMVSELHAGFIINTGKATAKNVLDLIDIIKERVYNLSGVELHEELRKLGNF